MVLERPLDYFRKVFIDVLLLVSKKASVRNLDKKKYSRKNEFSLNFRESYSVFLRICKILSDIWERLFNNLFTLLWYFVEFDNRLYRSALYNRTLEQYTWNYYFFNLLVKYSPKNSYAVTYTKRWKDIWVHLLCPTVFLAALRVWISKNGQILE